MTADKAPNASTAEAPIPPALSWRIVVLCALVCLFDGYDMVVAPISIPALSADWGLAPQQFSLALAAGVMGMGLGAAFIAPMGDRYGRRPLIIACCALIAISCLLVPLTESVAELTALRFATGLGMGASIANALALVSEYAVPHLRSRIIACVYAMSALGGAVGGFVAPAILAGHGWEGTYFIGGILPLVLLPALLWGLSESRYFLQAKAANALDGSGKKTEPPGALRSLALLLGSSYRIDTLLLWALFFLCISTTYMISSWLPTLMNLSGWSIENSARAIMSFSFGGVLGGFVLGWLVDSGRVRTAIFTGFGATAAALVLLNLVPDNLAVWMVLIVLMGSGTIGVSYALVAVAAIVYPTHLRAAGIGSGGAVGRLGAAIAPLIGGLLLALDLSALEILSGLVIPMVAAMLIVLKFSSRFVRQPSID